MGGEQGGEYGGEQGGEEGLDGKESRGTEFSGVSEKPSSPLNNIIAI